MENVPVTSDQGRVYDLIISADINHNNWDNHQWPMQCSRVTVCHHYSGDRDAGPEMGHWECVHITQCQDLASNIMQLKMEIININEKMNM